MSKKILIWIGVFVGSTLGGFVPALWGGNLFSFSGLLFSTLGALLGIYLGFTFGE